MNEAVRVRLSVDGENGGIASLSDARIVLTNDGDTPPRGISVILQPDNPITEFRLRRVRMIQDWQPNEFRVNLAAENGAIKISGAGDRSFPAGRYSLRVEISGLVPQMQPVRVIVPENVTVDVVLAYQDDPRQVVLTATVDEFDELTRNVVTQPGSVVDDMPVSDWLTSPLPRARRKACLLNLLLMLRGSSGSRPKAKLISNVNSLFFADVDRVYARVDTAFLADLETMVADPAKPFYAEGPPTFAVHRNLLGLISQWEPDADAYSLLSYRREGNPSLQAVIAIPPDGASARQHYAGLDIDLGNPLQDVHGIMIHLGGLLAPGKTNHLSLAKTLHDGPFADFIYYKVTQEKVKHA